MFNSEAKCLGAKTVCRQAFDYSEEARLISEVVTDLEALEAVELFLGQSHVIVSAFPAAAHNDMPHRPTGWPQDFADALSDSYF